MRLTSLRTLAHAVSLLLLVVAAVGCAGGRTRVVAPNATIPVSMSRAVFDERGEILPAERRSVVGTYHLHRRAWSVVYNLVPITPTTDLSRSLSDQAAAAGGDAVIHLSIAVEHCPYNFFFIPMGILPFWPGCADVDVTGQIIRVVDTSARAAPYAVPLVDYPGPQIVETGEDGDEWLHEHCSYEGLITADNQQDARDAARARNGDVVEPLSGTRRWGNERSVDNRRVAKVFRCRDAARAS